MLKTFNKSIALTNSTRNLMTTLIDTITTPNPKNKDKRVVHTNVRSEKFSSS